MARILVRRFVVHGKVKLLGEALTRLPSRKFDKKSVATPYVDGFGTQVRMRARVACESRS